MTTLFLVELTFADIQASDLEKVANRIKAAIEESITPFETSLKGYTIVNKPGDTFYSVGKSEQKKLWDTKPKTGIAWLKQAKEFGYGWAESALKQADEDANTVVGDLYSAVSVFAFWENTSEGVDYWEKLCATIRSKTTERPEH